MKKAILAIAASAALVPALARGDATSFQFEQAIYLDEKEGALSEPEGVAPAAWIIEIDSRTEVPAEITSSMMRTRPATLAPTSVPPSP